jgi:hypothetical protein
MQGVAIAKPLAELGLSFQPEIWGEVIRLQRPLDAVVEVRKDQF